MTLGSSHDFRSAAREHAGKAAETGAGCGSVPGCCGPGAPGSWRSNYGTEELAGASESADLSLGCGQPQAVASLRPGETVLDLGSGAGFDCFLAARQVGLEGQVIGVDRTGPLVTKARKSARAIGATNVEFRIGDIERLPVADASIDVILSNCVLNLSSDKQAVLSEAFRVLKPGGRLAIADVVTTGPMPETLAHTVASMTGCAAGATAIESLQALLQRAGFEHIRIVPKPASRLFIRDWLPGAGAENYIVSATIEAYKFAATSSRGPSCCS